MYHLYTFDAKALPTRRPDQDLGAGPALAPSFTLPSGGVYDYFSTDAAPTGGTIIRHRGAIMSTTAATLRTEFDEWRAMVGTRARLVRLMDDDDRQIWINARLMEIDADRALEDTWLDLDFEFQQIDPIWHGVHRGEGWVLDSGEVLDDGLQLDDSGARTLSASPITLTWHNHGNMTVKNPVITVTAGSANITALQVERLGTGAIAAVEDWDYTGTITAGQSLVVDCGAWSVKNNGSDDWDNFAFDSVNHLSEEMINMPPGDVAIKFTFTGGDVDSTVVVAYDDGWA
jgi:hypothetical protein